MKYFSAFPDFEPGIGVWEKNIASSGSVADKSDDYPLDSLQALNTTLCFLSSINADVAEVVERFVILHPESLLLEGAGILPEESAKYILQDRMRHCRCTIEACNQNRSAILRLLSRGFEHYHQVHLEQQDSPQAQLQNWVTTLWGKYGEDLITLEREIRELRVQEMSLRGRFLETACEVRHYQGELERVQSSFSTGAHKLTALSLLACHLQKNKTDLFARKSVLEYQVGVAQVNLTSVEREHREALHKIRNARRVQFSLLTTAFEGCQRHVCVTSASTITGSSCTIPAGAL